MRSLLLAAVLVLGLGSAAFAGSSHYAVIEITNTTSGSLKYMVEWAGEKKIFEVGAGESRWHAVEVADGEQIELPIITTDVDPSEGQRLASFELEVETARRPDFGVGAQYTFGFNADGSELEIAAK